MSLKVKSPLVSVKWLHENIEAENLLIFDATIPKVGLKTDENSTKEQIPKAVFFDIKNTFSDTTSKYPNTILHPEEFEFKAQNLGVNNNSCIVVYDDIGVYSSPRVWWMFTTFGFTNIAVLDGGFPAWKQAGFIIEKPKSRELKKGTFESDYQPEKIRFTEDVVTSIQEDVCIVDARSQGRFLGLESEPRKEIRSGHIPSSKNLPFSVLQEGGKMKSSSKLRSVFEKINPSNKELIFSCGSGITACILALGAELSENKNYSVYDGSWTEWGSRSNLPIESVKKSNWSKKEFETYVLLYCAQSNFIETQEERNYIIRRVDEQLFNAIHTEIVHDSNEESLKKIKNYLIEHKFSLEEKKDLIRDIKNVFFADGTVDKYEKHVFELLQKMLL